MPVLCHVPLPTVPLSQEREFENASPYEEIEEEENSAMSERGTIELTLFLVTATDGSPHGWAACMTLYAVNKSHAYKRAQPWIAQHSPTLPNIEIEPMPNGFTIHTTELPGKVRAHIDSTNWEVQP
jgi:hypothetical protein